MAEKPYIVRKLWYEGLEGREEVLQSDLHERSEPLVILGEAGMGKSELLKWLAIAPHYSLCTARQLINRNDPLSLLGDASVLVIDALDQVSTQKEGDAVDWVLRQLGKLEYPRFVLACRVADWRSATGLEAIREQYPEEPLEMHLIPFDNDDASRYLSFLMDVDTANDVVKHFLDKGLGDMLGNPQTLDLIAPVAIEGSLPDSRGDLFEQAVTILQLEHSRAKAYSQLSLEQGLDAAGAIAAGIILTGNEAVVRATNVNVSEGDLQLAEVKELPGAHAAEEVLSSRLFAATGVDRFSYIHRRVGEYLGARWLAKQGTNHRQRRRLLSLFHGFSLVPASLRGIHAWLARDPVLSNAVINADPMGVIEYGDADNLTLEQARALLQALERIAMDNPHFRGWGPYSLRGLAKPELIDDLRRLITNQSTTYGLSTLILEAIKGSGAARELTDDMLGVIRDREESFGCRYAAGEVLADLRGDAEWQAILRDLLHCGDEESIRLAIRLARKCGIERIDNDLVIDQVLSWATSEVEVTGVLSRLDRLIPDERIEGLLNCLVVEVRKAGKAIKRPGKYEVTDFAYRLVARALDAGPVDAHKVWSWLEPFESADGYDSENRKHLDEIFRADRRLRLAVQRYVLFDSPGDKNLWRRQARLGERLPGLMVTAADAIALLKGFDPADHRDERWRELIRLVQLQGEEGSEVLAAARPFAEHRPDLLQWLEKLANPHVGSMARKASKLERKRKAKKAVEVAGFRKHFTANLHRMREGDYASLIDLAKAYLNLYSNIVGDGPAHERVAHWIGEEVGNAANEGFEAFLQRDPPIPTAGQIVEALSQGKHYDAGYIITAAFAERFRKGIGFDDLSNERLMAGLFELRRSHVEGHSGIDGLSKAIETEIRSRGIWEEAVRLYYEPQLEAQRKVVDSLHSLMREESDVELGASFAAEWLDRFPNLPFDPETELIDKLLATGRFGELRRIAAARTELSDEARRRNWDAVGIIVDFRRTAKRLEARPIDPQLLWELRDRLHERFSVGSHIPLSPVQVEWVITNFRTVWPRYSRPTETTTGDTNFWDATDFMVRLFQRLGNDSSDAAVEALRRLKEVKAVPPDGYTDLVRVLIAEQTRIRVEGAYSPPTLAALNAITRDIAPMCSADLQALVAEELDVIQRKVRSDDVESWRGFFGNDDVPFAEERCRDHLLGLLRQGDSDITYEPESHVADDKEVDIGCSVGTVRMPIEVKGQWHSNLWSGADEQLDALYTQDWRAEHRGIYLVLWFGEQQVENKRLTSPGRSATRPTNSLELREMLIGRSRAAKEGRVMIIVLDLDRSHKG